MSELEKIDVVEEFIERMKVNAKPIYQFIREGKGNEDVVQLHLILANYANTEHTLNILKKQRLELKRKLDAFHGFLVKLHNQSRDVKVNAFLGGIIKKFEELKEDENHEGKRMQIRT